MLAQISKQLSDQTHSENCQLVGQADGIEPSLISDVPAAVAEVVNGKTVALSPVPVNLAHIVEARGVIIGRLEVLRLEELVRVRKLDLPQHLLVGSAAQARHLGGTTGCVTCNKGVAAAPHEHGGGGLHALVLRLGTGRQVGLAVDHDRLLAAHGLLHDGRLLGVDEAGLALRHGAVSRLLLGSVSLCQRSNDELQKNARPLGHNT